MKFKLINRTTGKFVLDDEGKEVECIRLSEAFAALAQVNDLKSLNPEHRDDDIQVFDPHL